MNALLTALIMALTEAFPSIWQSFRKGDVETTKRRVREETDRVIDAYAAKVAVKAARKVKRAAERVVSK